jgi:hypothetical protein
LNRASTSRIHRVRTERNRSREVRPVYPFPGETSAACEHHLIVLVELKSVSEITELFKKITQNYVRLIPLQLGFLLNFNEAHLKDGIVRVVNGAEGKPFFGS